MKKIILILSILISIETFAVKRFIGITIVGTSFNAIDSVKKGSDQWVDLVVGNNFNSYDTYSIYVTETNNNAATMILRNTVFSFTQLPINPDNISKRFNFKIPTTISGKSFKLECFTITNTSGDIGLVTAPYVYGLINQRTISGVSTTIGVNTVTGTVAGTNTVVGTNTMVGVNTIIGVNTTAGIITVIGVNTTIGINTIIGVNTVRGVNTIVGIVTTTTGTIVSIYTFVGVNTTSGIDTTTFVGNSVTGINDLVSEKYHDEYYDMVGNSIPEPKGFYFRRRFFVNRVEVKKFYAFD